MCGIAGFLELTPATPGPELSARAGRMADALAHRGPDDRGVWVDAASGVAFGHRRLSIVDLSASGHQPMTSTDGRFTLTYNGEIYNYRALRAELAAAGAAFRGTSDTEVMLAAVSAWGVRDAVRRFNGIFAFAVWDRATKTLSLARDHLGVKPLYWGRCGSTILFGSELKALRAHPAFAASVDRDALAGYLRLGYVEAPRTIWAGIAKLPAGCCLAIAADGSGAPEPYWSVRDAAARGLAAPLRVDEAEATDRLAALLDDAIGLQMVADVPVGAFLSGGVDSSLVVALMRRRSPHPVRTFTIGFREGAHDESAHARAVATHLGTDHTELILDPAEARAVIPDLPAAWDEPFADVSAIPTLLVSRLARRSVTVSLSGDGGDELFGGYRKYAWGGVGRGWPGWVRRGVAAGLTAVPPAGWDGLARALGPLAPRGVRSGPVGARAHKLARMLAAPDAFAAFGNAMTLWPDPGALVPGAAAVPSALTDPGLRAAAPDPAAWMPLADQAGWLPDDILVKLDRASMAVALEGRVPLLDHRVVEFAWSLPPALRAGKRLLRHVLFRHVPAALVDRPKEGFGVPVAGWLRGPLRDWAESLLSESALRSSGLVEPGPVRAAWADHLAGRADSTQRLWAVLMLEAWRARG